MATTAELNSLMRQVWETHLLDYVQANQSGLWSIVSGEPGMHVVLEPVDPDLEMDVGL